MEYVDVSPTDAFEASTIYMIGIDTFAKFNEAKLRLKYIEV